jgi:imidazolonepropionase-like amidohydrolase
VTLDEAEPTAIVDVRVFDSQRGTVGPPSVVILQDGRIAGILPADGPVPTGITVVDGHGGTLLPGLVDVHVHLGASFALPGRVPLPDPRANLAAFAASGVTSVLDLSMPIDAVDRWRRRVEHGLPGPEIFASGRPFGAPDGHPVASIRAMYPGPLVRAATRHLAWTPTDDAGVDAAIADEGPRDAIKVIIDAIPADGPVISDAVLARLRLAATALDRPLVAHVGRPEDVDRAVALPVDALAHLPYGGALADDTVLAVVRGGIPVIATLAVWQSIEDVDRGAVQLTPLAASLADRGDVKRIAALDRGELPLPAVLHTWAATVEAHHDERIGNLARLREAGASLLVGSDSPNLGMIAGAGTHAELDALVAAGMSPPEALMAATWVGSRFLDADARFGAIQPGWEADLLLVDGDPTVDIAAVHAIRAVWLDGRRLVP